MNKHHKTGKRRPGRPRTRPAGSPEINVYVRRARELKAAGVGVRLMSKPEVMLVANASYTSIWKWMQAGTFPRSRIVAGRSMWLSSEIDAWLAGLPPRPLKGDGDAEDSEDLEEAI